MKPERLAREVIYESKWVNLYLDRVRLPNGAVIEQFRFLDFPHPAVTAIVENQQGEVIFCRVYRYTTGTNEWELPAGGVEEGESILEAAGREVLEESGYDSTGWELLYSFHPQNGSGNKVFHVVICKALEKVGDFDPDEVSETHWFTPSEIEQMLKDRYFSDGFTLTALLLWLRHDRSG
ncbi:MAG: NUDIX hydrolase [Anaerolineaceae bacterium]